MVYPYRNGQRVVCIRDDWPQHRYSDGTYFPVACPKKGAVYTIREMLNVDDRPWPFRQTITLLSLNEIEPTRLPGEYVVHMRWDSNGFRPFRDIKTNIDSLTQLLQPLEDSAATK